MIDGERLARRAELGGAVWFDEIGSTNDWAKDWLRGEAANDGREPFASFPALRPPFFVGATRQTAGRGRDAHSWSDWSGSLLFSLVARWDDFQLTRRESAILSRRIAAAVAETARELAANAPFFVKEPNDVYVFGRKLAGVLIESPNPKSVVVGVGVNVGNRSESAPLELRANVVSLVEALEKTSSAPPNVDFLREEFAVRAVRKMLNR